MSTILDALRKVEEEKRAHEADVRARLLATSSSRFDLRTRRRKQMPWIIGGVLLIAGAIVGAGMMKWIPFGSSAKDLTQSAPPPAQPQAANPPAQVVNNPPRAPEPGKPAPQVRITPKAPATVPPPAPGNAPVVAEAFPQYNPWHGGTSSPTVSTGEAQSQSLAAVARASGGVEKSPFVNSSPYDQIVAPASTPPPKAPPVTARAKAPEQRPSAPEKSTPQPVVAAPKNPVTENEERSRPAASSETTAEGEAEAPPNASLAFLQWSADPEKRVASIKVGSGPATIAHEGETVDGMTVVKIRPNAVELRSGSSRYVLKTR